MVRYIYIQYIRFCLQTKEKVLNTWCRVYIYYESVDEPLHYSLELHATCTPSGNDEMNEHMWRETLSNNGVNHQLIPNKYKLSSYILDNPTYFGETQRSICRVNS